MMTGRTRYLERIDLASVNATDLQISTEVRLGEVLCGSILQHCFSDEYREQGWCPFGTSYSRKNIRHSVFGTVHGLSIPAQEQLIRIGYSAPSDWKPPPGLEPISSILSVLETYAEECELSCRVVFLYDNGQYDSMIKLPLAPETPTGPEVDEIRGLRLTRTRDNLVVYSLVIDRPENEDTQHALSFTYRGRFSTALPGQVMEQATRISRGFVRERKSE